MRTTHNAMLAAVCLGALHDILLHAVVGDHAVQEPGPDRGDTSDFGEERDDMRRGFAPGSRASADMSGLNTKGPEASPVPEPDWRALDLERELYSRGQQELQMHANLRGQALALALHGGTCLPDAVTVERARVFYDFLCYGAEKPAA